MQALDKKKAIALAILSGLLAVYWGYSHFFGRTEMPAAPAKEASQKAKEAAAGPPTAQIKVDMELLSRPKEQYKAGRNIFSPVYRKPVLIKVVRPGNGGQPGDVDTAGPPPPPPPPPKSAEEIAAENATEEMQKFKVLGLLNHKGRTEVFLSLGNDNFTAAKGEDITKGYYLNDIGTDYIVIVDKDTNVTVKIDTKLDENAGGASNTVPSPGIEGAKRQAGAPMGPVPSVGGRTSPDGQPHRPSPGNPGQRPPGLGGPNGRQ